MMEGLGAFVKRLEADFPDIRIKFGRKFGFRAPRTVTLEKWADGVAREPMDDGWGSMDGGAGRGSTDVWVGGEYAQDIRRELNRYKLEALHEFGHAKLQHRRYQMDVERLKMERAAWEEARKMAPKYGVEYEEEFVEARMDSYRDWLHQRSKCPKCGMTRYQTEDGEYHCLECGSGL